MASSAQLARVDAVLDGSALLGAELDTQYRVLALTVEPAPERDPRPGGPDRRLQILASPCATFTALLVRDEGGASVVERFSSDQLPDIVAALEGPVIAAPVVGVAGPPTLPDDVSLHGESSAVDGRSHHLLIDVTGGARRLVVTATFDDVEIRDPSGEAVTLE